MGAAGAGTALPMAESLGGAGLATGMSGKEMAQMGLLGMNAFKGIASGSQSQPQPAQPLAQAPSAGSLGSGNFSPYQRKKVAGQI